MPTGEEKEGLFASERRPSLTSSRSERGDQGRGEITPRREETRKDIFFDSARKGGGKSPRKARRGEFFQPMRGEGGGGEAPLLYCIEKRLLFLGFSGNPVKGLGGRFVISQLRVGESFLLP